MKTIKAKVHHIPTNKPEEWYKHLYITTDDQIKEGDWFINTGSGGHPTPKVYQANSENSKAFKEFGPYPEIRKIIATTDPKILGKSKITETKKAITHSIFPSIPHSFIEEYCKAGGIDEVLVEGEEIMFPLKERWGEVNREFTPKLDSNNCIIIHPVEKKMYSREEVINAFKYAFKEAKEAVIWSSDYPIYVANKWIEENL